MGTLSELASDVDAAVCRFEHLLLPDVPGEVEALAKARVVLVQAVNTYIARLGGLAAADRGAGLRDELARVIELRRRYSEHIARFDTAAIATDWPTYRRNCRQLVVAMRAHFGRLAALDAA